LSTLFIVQQALFLQLIILLNFGSSISEGILFARQPAQGWNRSMFRQVKPTKISTRLLQSGADKVYSRLAAHCGQLPPKLLS